MAARGARAIVARYAVEIIVVENIGGEGGWSSIIDSDKTGNQSVPKPPIPYQFISPNDLGFDFSFASGGGHNMEPPISSSHDALDHLTQKANS